LIDWSARPCIVWLLVGEVAEYRAHVLERSPGIEVFSRSPKQLWCLFGACGYLAGGIGHECTDSERPEVAGAGEVAQYPCRVREAVDRCHHVDEFDGAERDFGPAVICLPWNKAE
jgi:hypothetical protein